MFKFNPKKCNFSSSFSGFVHRDKSKYLIALPTDSEQVKLFERTLIGSLSCVNTRLAFDSKIPLPKNGRDNFKLIYDIKTGTGMIEKKRVTTKILKMDENNQYGNAMTKPLQYGCIKNLKKSPPFANLMLF